MNNIEILEDYIEALRKPKPFKYTNEQKAQAIENLIKENKELKEKLEEKDMQHELELIGKEELEAITLEFVELRLDRRRK